MWLENFLKHQRVKKIREYVPANSVLCDLGCGPDAFLLKTLKSRVKKGIGIDKKSVLKKENFSGKKLEFINSRLEKQIPLASDSVDYITMLAVLEHLSFPEVILEECFRILKKNGRLIITTPLPVSKSILEFLAFKLRVLSREEIGEHINYFSLPQLKNILEKIGFSLLKLEKFELGFNALVLARKD